MNKEWLTAFGHMTYGIYVLTARFENTINGMIASWVTQVFYEPPLIMRQSSKGSPLCTLEYDGMYVGKE
jgi:flavin reductase (DIM6/NTAB) family NADH-FMN oxidoreductase RutF